MVLNWDEVLNDDELMQQIKKLALGNNPTASLKACEWIAEGKGYLVGAANANIESIRFHGLDDPKEVDNTGVSEETIDFLPENPASSTVMDTLDGLLDDKDEITITKNTLETIKQIKKDEKTKDAKI